MNYYFHTFYVMLGGGHPEGRPFLSRRALHGGGADLHHRNKSPRIGAALRPTRDFLFVPSWVTNLSS